MSLCIRIGLLMLGGILVVLLLWLYNDQHVSPPHTTQGHCYGGVPKHGAGDFALLHNVGYTTLYDEAHHNPSVTCYRLLRSRRLPYRSKRPSQFRMDRRTKSRITPRHYAGSGYDRGHMAPNYAIGRFYGRSAQQQTFLMSNIVPQRHSLNDGLWSYLEKKIADDYALHNDAVYVLTGPVYTRTRRMRSGVFIPDMFFLVVVRQRGRSIQTDSYLIPQSARRYDNPKKYKTNITQIEKLTGLTMGSAKQ